MRAHSLRVEVCFFIGTILGNIQLFDHVLFQFFEEAKEPKRVLFFLKPLPCRINNVIIS